MEIEKRSVTQRGTPAKIHGQHRLDFARECDTPTPARGADIDPALPSLKITLVGDQRHSVAEVTKKNPVLARADDLFRFVVDVVNAEHVSSLFLSAFFPPARRARRLIRVSGQTLLYRLPSRRFREPPECKSSCPRAQNWQPF